jgi:hypothetical protein
LENDCVHKIVFEAEIVPVVVLKEETKRPAAVQPIIEIVEV